MLSNVLKTITIIGISTLSFGSPSLTLANSDQSEFSGAKLLEMCSSDAEMIKEFCTTWVSGFLAGVDMSKQMSKEPVCLAPYTTGTQAALVIKHFLTITPQTWQLPGALAAYTALAVAYPCSR